MPFLLLVTILLTLGTIALVILAWLLLNKVPISGFPPSFFVDTYPTIIVSALFSLLGFVSIVLLYHSDRNKQKLLLSNPPNIIHEPSRFYYIFKRSIDIVLATFGIIMLAPAFAIVALCIKLDDGGKIIDFREVIGYEGRRFSALKFRTMIHFADEFLVRHPELVREYQQNMEKLEYDLLMTKTGRFLRKTSLDELPQLFNVLVGQMSLVGPHIIHPSELPHYGEFARKLLSVKPGITGLSQISGRQHINYDERVLLDMRYIDNRSLSVDFTILLKTLKVIIVHTGA
jgi:lipopolysaccharide/colanic/teichoic acid biosynthesis glycosyltransferase